MTFLFVLKNLENKDAFFEGDVGDLVLICSLVRFSLIDDLLVDLLNSNNLCTSGFW